MTGGGCAVQPTDDMLELASDKRDEAMTAVSGGNLSLLLWPPYVIGGHYIFAL